MAVTASEVLSVPNHWVILRLRLALGQRVTDSRAAHAPAPVDLYNHVQRATEAMRGTRWWSRRV